MSDRRSGRRNPEQPHGGASLEGEPVKLEADVRATLYEAVGIDWQEQKTDASRLIQQVAKVLGTHVGLADELDKEPRTNEQLRLIRKCASRAEGLLDAMNRLNIETSDVINQITGDADLVTFAELLRTFSHRLAMAERRLLEYGQDSGGRPRKTARAITLRNLVSVFRTFSPEGTDADLVEFLRAACAAATDRTGKSAPIRLPARSGQILTLLPTAG